MTGSVSISRVSGNFNTDAGLTAIFAQTPVAMAVLEGHELRYTFANPKYRQIIGGRNPVGMRLIEMFPELAGSTIEGVLERVHDTLEPFAATDLLIRFDSQGAGDIDNYYDLAYHPLLNAEGGVRGVLVVAVDVTERRAAHELERQIAATEAVRAEAEAGLVLIAEAFRQAPSFLAVFLGPTHIFALANEAYYQLIGHGRDIIGKPLIEALPEVAGQGFDVLLDNVLATGESFVARELSVRLERSAGSAPDERVVSLTYLPLLDREGNRTGVVAHGTDVTEYVNDREAGERLLAVSELARADAEAATRAKADFLAVMSHELRTPLNAIGGYAELLEMGIRGEINEEQRDDLRRIQLSQRHLLGLIDQVLNHARVGTSSIRYDRSEIDAAAAMAAAEALVAPQIRAHSLRFVIGQCMVPVRARADAPKLQQILLNLLSNAIKFTRAGGEITGRCAVHEGFVTLSIADTGIGIAADKLATIFDPFVQIDPSLTRANSGVGLGLAISRDLARAMDGDLTVESALGVGSRFTLTLPAA